MEQQQGKDMRQAFRGRRFEEIVEASNRHYRAEGLAVIAKTDAKMRKIGGKWVHAEKGPPDFLGCFMGAAVAFDAKDTAEASFPLKHIIEKPHQLRFLLDVEKMGGLAFFLVRMKKYDRFFALPASQVNEAVEQHIKHGARKSIPLEDMTNEVFRGFHVALDYLAVWHGIAKGREKNE